MLEESEEKMKDFESREGSLDRIIGNLKTEITHLNDKISEASKRSEEMDSQHLSQVHFSYIIFELSINALIKCFKRIIKFVIKRLYLMFPHFQMIKLYSIF